MNLNCHRSQLIYGYKKVKVRFLAEHKNGLVWLNFEIFLASSFYKFNMFVMPPVDIFLKFRICVTSRLYWDSLRYPAHVHRLWMDRLAQTSGKFLSCWRRSDRLLSHCCTSAHNLHISENLGKSHLSASHWTSSLLRLSCIAAFPLNHLCKNINILTNVSLSQLLQAVEH